MKRNQSNKKRTKNSQQKVRRFRQPKKNRKRISRGKDRMHSFRNKKEIPEMKDKIPILYVTFEA